MMKRLIGLVLASICMVSQPAFACLSCGCESSGSSSDISSLNGASSIFSKGKKFLVQFGSGFKSVNGSFNELGTWNPSPVDSGLYSVQNTLGILYFPSQQLSLGLQFPLITNMLNKATWGSFGSIAPTDLDSASVGTAFGDISAQGTYKFYENNDLNFASAIWGKANIPTGQVTGKPEYLSGSGVTNLAAGILGLKKYGKFELLANLGYQQPLGKSPDNTSSFSIGNAFLFQLQSNYQISQDLKLGLGINGVIGKWLSASNKDTMTSSKIKLLGTAQYDFTMYNGVGLTVGYDPRAFGANSMTDTSMSLVFYQFI